MTNMSSGWNTENKLHKQNSKVIVLLGLFDKENYTVNFPLNLIQKVQWENSTLVISSARWSSEAQINPTTWKNKDHVTNCCVSHILSLLVSLRWDVHAASVVGAGTARSAAGTVPAGICSGSCPPVHSPLWSRVQQPTAPALPSHTGSSHWWVRARHKWYLLMMSSLLL